MKATNTTSLHRNDFHENAAYLKPQTLPKYTCIQLRILWKWTFKNDCCNFSSLNNTVSLLSYRIVNLAGWNMSYCKIQLRYNGWKNKLHNMLYCKIFVILQTKKVYNITISVYWVRVTINYTIWCIVNFVFTLLKQIHVYEKLYFWTK